MMKTTISKGLRTKTKFSAAAGALAIGLAAVLLLLPLPTGVLDVLIALNLGLSLVILFAVLFCPRPVMHFSQFPTMLLVSTAFGLALNVASTRLILVKGEAFDGRMVRAVAGFVTGGGRLVIGAIIFLAIIVVQVVVTGKTLTRIAEVMARFSLDAMKSKFMAIDADMHSGAIDEKEARLRQKDLLRAQQFYSAMDGAAKFIAGIVKGNIYITVVTILGGIIIESVVRGKTAADALGIYIAFAIGNGFLALTSLLLISSAMFLIITRPEEGAEHKQRGEAI